MCVRAHDCVYYIMCVCVCTGACVCVAHVCMCACVCACVCVCVHMIVCIYYVCACTGVCICIAYVCMCACVCVHRNIYNLWCVRVRADSQRVKRTFIVIMQCFTADSDQGRVKGGGFKR